VRVDQSPRKKLETFEKYLAFLEQEDIFSPCANASTLEIGPLTGKISKLIQKKRPSKHVTVEPDPAFRKNLQSFTTNHSCTYQRYINAYQNEFDVVVCMGVLYHMHSPWDMIEKIITINKPKTFILETIDVGDAPRIHPEEINTTGMAWDTIVPYIVNMPIKYYREFLEGQGYEQSKCYVMREHGIQNASKQRQVLMVFNK
jgi:hypothetical protein